MEHKVLLIKQPEAALSGDYFRNPELRNSLEAESPNAALLLLFRNSKIYILLYRTSESPVERLVPDNSSIPVLPRDMRETPI